MKSLIIIIYIQGLWLVSLVLEYGGDDCQAMVLALGCSISPQPSEYVLIAS